MISPLDAVTERQVALRSTTHLEYGFMQVLMTWGEHPIPSEGKSGFILSVKTFTHHCYCSVEYFSARSTEDSIARRGNPGL
jgi:hypothetical protein